MRALRGITALLAAAAALPAQADELQATTTAAGLRIFDFPGNGADRFWLAVAVDVGGRDEPEAHAGIAHLLEHALFLSAADRPKAFDDHEARRRAVTFNGFTSNEHTVYYLTAPSDQWRFGVDWLADHVARPRLDPAEVERERRTVLQEITEGGGGHDLHDVSYLELIYGRHPVARSVGGSVATVTAVGVEDLRRFHARYYCAANLAVGFAGAVPRDECTRAIEAAFADLPTGERASSTPVTPRTGGLMPLDVTRSKTLLSGFHLQLHDVDDLARAMVLGGYLDARMFAVAREERGLAYSPGVDLERLRDAQRLEFNAETTRPADVAELAAIVEQLVEEVRSAPDPELLRAHQDLGRRWVVGSSDELCRALQLASWIARHDGDATALAATAAQLSADDLRAAASAWLTPERFWSLSRAASAIRDVPWVLLGLLALVLVGLAARGWRPLAARLRTAVGRRRAGRARRPTAPIRRVGGDELERQFQRYFEATDGPRDERQGDEQQGGEQQGDERQGDERQADPP